MRKNQTWIITVAEAVGRGMKQIAFGSRYNTQTSAGQTRWLDRILHSDIAIQHTTGSKLKFTNFLSRNPLEKATTKDVHVEKFVDNILSKYA